MATAVTWKYLSQEQTAALSSCENAAEIKSYLDRELSLQCKIFDGEEPERREVLLNLFVLGVLQADRWSMDDAQTSTFIGILYDLLVDSMSANLTMEQAYDAFLQLLLRHSVHRPPWSAEVFTLEMLRQIHAWSLQHVFRHYKLFFFLFGQNEELDLSTVDTPAVVPETIPTAGLPPLREATTLAAYEEKLAAEAALKKQQAEDEAKKKAAEHQEHQQHEANRQKALEEENRQMVSTGALREHLSQLKDEFSSQTSTKLDGLEKKLAEMEKKLGL